MRSLRGLAVAVAFGLACACGCELVTGFTGEVKLRGNSASSATTTTTTATTAATSTGSSTTATGSSTATSGTGGTSTGTGGSSPGSGGNAGSDGGPTCASCWADLWGGTSSQEALAVATDASGSTTYVGGRFQGTMQLDPTNSLTADSNSQNGFLVGLQADGSIMPGRVMRIHALGGASGTTEEVSVVAVDGNGNVIVGGYSDHIFELPNNAIIPAGLFAVKFTNAFVPIWSIPLGGSDGSSMTSVAAGPNDTTVMCGGYLGQLNLPNTPTADGGPTGAGTSAWVAVVDGSGVVTNNAEWGEAVCNGAGVDGSGNVVVAGSFEGQIQISTGAPMQSAGLHDVFLAELGSDLSVQWQKRFGDGSDQYCQGLALDGSGNLALTGRFSGTLDFDGVNLNAGTSNSLYFVTYSEAGAVGWGHSFGSFMASAEVHPAFDSAGDLALAGGFFGQIKLGRLAREQRQGERPCYLRREAQSGRQPALVAQLRRRVCRRFGACGRYDPERAADRRRRGKRHH